MVMICWMVAEIWAYEYSNELWFTAFQLKDIFDQ